MLRGLVTRGSALTVAAVGAYQLNNSLVSPPTQCHNHGKLSTLRDTDFNLAVHHHGKAKVMLTHFLYLYVVV